MNGRRIYRPQGRGLGGGSAMNAMTYVRGQPADYEAWVRVGNEGWDFETVLAAFRSLEKNQVMQDRFHGRDGLLSVSDQVHPHRLTRAFVEAGQQAGFPSNRDFNGSTQEGVGTYQVTQINGKRCSAADAFLAAARGRSNLRVLTHAYATRVCFDRLRATGLEFLANGQLHTATAEREVIVSGGACKSPPHPLPSGGRPPRDPPTTSCSAPFPLPARGGDPRVHLNPPRPTWSAPP